MATHTSPWSEPYIRFLVFGSRTIFSHKVVEERSSSSRRFCLRWTEEVALLESQKYRQYAADCVRLAQTMASTDKQTLLEIAVAWETRAQEAERLEKRKG